MAAEERRTVFQVPPQLPPSVQSFLRIAFPLLTQADRSKSLVTRVYRQFICVGSKALEGQLSYLVCFRIRRVDLGCFGQEALALLLRIRLETRLEGKAELRQSGLKRR